MLQCQLAPVRWPLVLLLVFVVMLQGICAELKNQTQTRRVYIDAAQDPAWKDGEDVFQTLGFTMYDVGSGRMDTAVRSLRTDLGTVTLASKVPIFKVDFAKAYKMDTPWPYCAGLHRCEVYAQKSVLPSADSVLNIYLPDNNKVQAIDFYLDIAIDCTSIFTLEVACTVTAYASHRSNAQMDLHLTSVCGSAQAGSYFGFYNVDGGIQRVSVVCGSAYPRALGLLRVGEREDDIGFVAKVQKIQGGVGQELLRVDS